MTDAVIYKKIFQRHVSREAQNYSLRDSNKKEYYDGVHPFFDFISTYRDEDTFKSNLKNLLFTIVQDTVTILIEQKEEKISLKIFQKSFSRKVGLQYFTLYKSLRYVTVNMKHGNIYFGELNNYQNKKKFRKKVRSNFMINDSFKTFRTLLKNLINEFSADQNTDVINEVTRIFLDKIDGGVKGLSSGDRLFKYYLDKKQIKYPNNFPLYSNFLIGNFRKKLKKLDNRLVDTFMAINDIKGKKLKKVLHVANHLNLSNYKVGLKLFGSDWINQDEKLLKDIFNNEVTLDLSDEQASQFNLLITPKEKKRVFSLYKIFNSNNEIDEWTLRDHFLFYIQLKRFGETDIEWKSTEDSDFFREEHLDWVNKLDHYKRGTYTRVYPKIYYDVIQNFEIDNVQFYPKLLTNSSEYNSESSVQSNCVKGYIGRVSSVIISLRKNDIDSNERLTIEYRINYLKNSDKSYLDRVQCLGKYNSSPDSSWGEALKILDSQIKKISNYTQFPFYKLTKECSNGVKFESDTIFNKDGYLEWTYKAIDNSGMSDYFLF